MDIWTKVPERGKSAHSLAVVFQSLANQLKQLPTGTEYEQIKLDKETRSIRVTITEDGETK